tara:strand:+ start:43151 stop:44092 length:942 start_codon:yes stop_codon:yes gene_type:complete
MYFKSNVYLNEFTINFEKYTSYPDISNIWTHMFIKSDDRFILKLYIKDLCERKLHMGLSENKVIIKENTYHIYNDIFKVDLEYINDMNSFVEYLNEVTTKKPMFDCCKIFILENIDCVHQNKHILSILTSNVDRNFAYFIVTGKKNIHHDFIESRMLTIRLPILSIKELMEFCEKNNIEVSKKQLQNLHKNSSSLLNMLLNLDMNVYKPIVDDVDTLLKLIIKSASKKNIGIVNYLQLVRENMYKLQSYNIKHDYICKRLIYIISKTYPKKNDLVHFVVTKVAELQHTIMVKSSKPMCHFEHFFIMIYERLVN